MHTHCSAYSTQHYNQHHHHARCSRHRTNTSPPPASPSPNIAHTTPQQDQTRKPDHHRRGKRKVSAIALTHTGHIIARDCLTRTTTLHWEGVRNDQCEICNTGGTLTECTRCNLVWNASCLHPTPNFPLREQDAMLCGEQCWAEITTAALNAGEQIPTRENHNQKR
jgi:hypothetical protein